MALYVSVGGRATLAAACLLLGSCASEVYRVPAKFNSAPERDARVMVVTQAFEVTPASGYPRTFKAGSTWRYVGRITQGRVYAIQDDVFMLEGKHMHEAHCVLADESMLVGFFLPVEEAYTPLSAPVRLPVTFK